MDVCGGFGCVHVACVDGCVWVCVSVHFLLLKQSCCESSVICILHQVLRIYYLGSITYYIICLRIKNHTPAGTHTINAIHESQVVTILNKCNIN